MNVHAGQLQTIERAGQVSVPGLLAWHCESFNLSLGTKRNYDKQGSSAWNFGDNRRFDGGKGEVECSG